MKKLFISSHDKTTILKMNNTIVLKKLRQGLQAGQLMFKAPYTLSVKLSDFTV